MKEILQIVPYMPPAVSGVGDYAAILAGELRDAHGWITTFLRVHPNDGQVEYKGFSVLSLHEHSAKELKAAIIGFDHVLLQYAGYGFQKRGCPLWLLEGLRLWKSCVPTRRLVTMFHELYASGPPWRSSFWTHPVQRWACLKLARLSDQIMTNREVSRRILGRHGHTNGQSLPVFSNVGECQTFVPLMERRPRLVVFGGGPELEKLLARQRNAIDSLLQSHGIEEVVVIGRMGSSLKDISENFKHWSYMDAGGIHEILSDSRLGLMDYFSGYLGKSGVFASYCAHGLVPILLKPSFGELDGLSLGMNYETLNRASSCSDARFTAIAQQAWAWYQQHSITETTKMYSSVLS